ncbi:MAG TPA: hypothetical protein PK684_05290 [Bacillota bacterium]|jgi:hypothetical protein|nr:hypothetical protein [Bacillota bacterium]
MNLDNISGMVDAIPLIMIYIVPGYIILRISNFQLSKKADQDQYILLKSLVVSFVFVSLEETLWKLVFPGTQTLCSPAFRNTVIASSAAVGFLWARFLISERFELILFELGIYKTLRSGIWSGVVDFEYGLWLMVYIPGDKVIYAGKLRRYMEIETYGNYVLFLSNYTLYNYNAEVLKDYVTDNDKWVSLHSKDIGRVELFYHEDSGKIRH